MSVLRHLESHRGFIRSNRDYLYRSLLAWEPLLTAWAGVDDGALEEMRPLLARTYRFLAPRFMPVTEWLRTNRPAKKPKDIGVRMAW
jgi:hypothetical protein